MPIRIERSFGSEAPPKELPELNDVRTVFSVDPDPTGDLELPAWAFEDAGAEPPSAPVEDPTEQLPSLAAVPLRPLRIAKSFGSEVPPEAMADVMSPAEEAAEFDRMLHEKGETPRGCLPLGVRHRRVEAGADEKQPSRRSFLGSAVSSLLAVGLIGGGGYLVYQGLQEKEQDAPLPDGVDDPNAKETGPDGRKPVAVEDSDDGSGDWEDEDGRSGNDLSSMDVDHMANMSVFIPAAKAYSRIRPTDHFESSRYDGFYGIKVPNNPKRTTWFSGGGPLVGGSAGTTLLAGHVAKRHVWGAFRRIYKLRGGEVVWTKDDHGQIQKWLVTKVFYKHHTKFPQEFWKKDGVRQLVVATCGGKAHRGWYSHNVFVVARPVPRY